MERSGCYIPSVDAKDIYIANAYAGNGYPLTLQDGQYNLRKFVNSFDYSLDFIHLAQIDPNFYFTLGRKRYSTKVINVTFKYAYKEYNNIRKDVYVRAGYNYAQIQFTDGICISDEKLIGIQLEIPIENPVDERFLAPYFSYSDGKYIKVKEPKVLMNRSNLREHLYREGFWAEGVHYVRMKRSSGSARVGKCLFIVEALYDDFHKWEMCGLDIRNGEPVDLAALEQYISLSTSSIISTIEIDPRSILIIDDYSSVFNEDVVNVFEEDGHLQARRENVEISNSIWDGQSLADSSLFPSDSKWGMMLLRNMFFKSCCFNCNLQKWFQDNNITRIDQLNGFTLAERIEDVKLITTPNSIKFMKFGQPQAWLEHIPHTFGVVKHEKQTHYFEGNAVQCHYQLLNTLQLSEQEMEEFLRPSLEFAQALKSDPAVVRYFIRYPNDKEYSPLPLLTNNDVVYNMMCVNDRFTQTKFYRDFTIDMMRAFYGNLKCGHVLVNGNYSVMCGNPIEMLRASIGQFDGTSQIGVGKIHSIRFPYGVEILGSRSPHVAMGNVLVTRNEPNELIDRYMNQTREIVYINSIGENILNRLSGSDFDSDSLLLTDNSILLNAAKRNYSRFLVPMNSVAAKKIKRFYTAEQQCDLDIKTGTNNIGQIVNLSQVLNNLFWNRVNSGESFEENQELYNDIAILDVMSGLEIDQAKREFNIDNKLELKRLSKKYADELTDQDGKKILPSFFQHISRKKGYYDPSRKNYMRHKSSMDYLIKIVNSFRVKHPHGQVKYSLISMFDETKYHLEDVDFRQIQRILSYIREFVHENKKAYASSSTNLEKHNLYMWHYERLDYKIYLEKINVSTMYHLLRMVENEEMRSIKNILFQILFKQANQSFNELVKFNREPISYLELGGTDLYLYGYGFKKISRI